MRTLERYIAAHVVWSTLLALAVLLALFSFLAFVDDIGSVGRGSYTMAGALEYMLLTAPRRAFALFPLAAVIGSVMGLGALAVSSELTVMRAAGVSTARIVGCTMKGAALLVLAAVIVGEIVAPWCERLAEERRSLAISDQIAMRTAHGFWIRDGSSFINIRRVLPGSRMADVYVYEFDDDRRLRVATRAQRAIFRNGAWQLEGIEQSTLFDDRVERREAERAEWQSSFEPELVDVVTVRPEALSALGLARYIAYLRENGLSTHRFELAMWNKAVYPLATAVMIFLAVPLVLGRLGRGGVGARIVVGALFGIAFHVVNQASGHLGVVYGLSPAGTALAPTFAFFLVGLWLLRQVE